MINDIRRGTATKRGPVRTIINFTLLPVNSLSSMFAWRLRPDGSLLSFYVWICASMRVHPRLLPTGDEDPATVPHRALGASQCARRETQSHVLFECAILDHCVKRKRIYEQENFFTALGCAKQRRFVDWPKEEERSVLSPVL